MTPRGGRRREFPEFPGPGDTVNTFARALTESLERLQAAYGGKNLAEYFDGRDGESVAKSTVSRWIAEPRRFPAVFLPVLCELDPTFRSHVFQHLAARIAAPDRVLQHLSPAAADEFRRVVAEQLALFDDVRPAPARRVRRRR